MIEPRAPSGDRTGKPTPPRTIATGTGSMRGDWNLRARDNYHCAIANVMDEESFARSGQKDAATIRGYLGDRVSPDARVLDYGCGVGRLLRPLASSFGALHGVDVSDEMIGRARERLADLSHVHLHLIDGPRLPFDDACFDLVYSLRVFQHMPKPEFRKLVPELARVIRPGGTFLFQLRYPYTFRRRMQAILRRDPGHGETYRRRFYTLGQLRRLLGEQGLRILSWNRPPPGKHAWYLAQRQCAESGAREMRSEGPAW